MPKLKQLIATLTVVVLALIVAAVGGQAQENVPATAPPPTAQVTPAETPAAETPAADAPATDAPAEPLTVGEAFLAKVIEGGWTMAFILAVSIFGIAFTIERLVNLRRARIVPAGLADTADELWKQGKFQQLEHLDERDDSTLARVISAIARHRRDGSVAVSTLAGDVASRDLRRHLQKAYPLAVVATLSPLLGLFGTVIGMIGAFDKVAAAGSLGDASLLGGDISKALITTGAGLAVAVPALALYHWFRSKTSLFGILLEEEASELILKWFAPNTPAETRPTNATNATAAPAVAREEVAHAR